MAMIEVKCSRCDTVLKVPESKAGRRGRCPICGGAVKVPVVKAAPAPISSFPKPSRTGLIWAAAGAAALIVIICLLVALGGHRKSSVTEESAGPTLTPEQQAHLDAQLTEIDRLQDVVKKYQALGLRERDLRARDVLMKISSYAPTTDYEFALRQRVLDEQGTAANSARKARADKLDTPLAPSEKDEMDQFSEELQTQSADLARELSAVGVFLTPAKDGLGRALIDGDDAAAKLAARRQRVVKDAGSAAS